jgi:hypothetical protein
MPTENDEPYFKNRSCAEAVIGIVMSAQMRGWMRLHGFVVVPHALEMVASPLRQGVSGVVAHIQAETIPLLTILLPQAGYVWARRYLTTTLDTQLALDAQLQMLLLAPVAQSIVKTASEYPYSSSNPRYSSAVAPYAGFSRPRLEHLMDTNELETVQLPRSTIAEISAQDETKVS